MLSVVSRSRLRGLLELRLARGEPLHQLGEVVAGEVPVERLGHGVPVVLELVERARHGGEVAEIVGREDLALEDREEDLDLVEPACVGGQVDEAEVRPAALEAVDLALAAVGGAVFDDPEDSPRRRVGLLGHHLPDETVEAVDPTLSLGTPDHRGTPAALAADVERREVGQRPIRS